MNKDETLVRRLVAIAIDAFLLGAVSLIVWILIIRFGAKSDLLLLVIIAALNLACAFYFILLHALGGQTLGKKIAKIKVVSRSGVPPNLGQSILRSLPLLIPALFTVTLIGREPPLDLATKIIGAVISTTASIFLFLDLGVCVMTEKNRALHDFIAGTIVVRTDV